jgi:hypothetical protein
MALPHLKRHIPRTKKVYAMVTFSVLALLVIAALKNGTQVEVILGSASTTLMDMLSTPAATTESRRREHELEEEEDAPTNLDEPLNILLFYADDWTMNVLGKLNPLVQTPNIDKMADNGILFTNNCVTTSMCWISRCTMITGTYASRHLFLDSRQETLFQTHPWNGTVFPLLKANGYYTGIVGKWHAPQPEPEMSMAFDYRNLYFGYHWEEREGRLEHVTDLNMKDAIDFLQNRPKDKNFALKVSFFATHAWDNHVPAYDCKNETKAQYYNNMKIPTPKTNSQSHWKRMPYFFKENNEGRNRYRNRFDRRNYQQNIKDLYRMATEVDYAVGQILETLKQQGVYNKTLLMFTTDNGNMHGGMYETKPCRRPAGIRIHGYSLFDPTTQNTALPKSGILTKSLFEYRWLLWILECTSHNMEHAILSLR